MSQMSQPSQSHAEEAQVNPPQAKDSTPDKPLHDVQKTPDERGIALQQVGISHVDFPMKLVEKTGGTQQVTAVANFTVGLLAASKGTHMSRFMVMITEWSRHKVFSLNFREFLEETRKLLDAPSAQMEVNFKYFVDKAAPVSGITAPMGYNCFFKTALVNDTYQFVLGVEVPMANLCPCSKAISDFGAHNQRAYIRSQVVIDPERDHPMVWIEDVIEKLDAQASCPVYPLLKREDEKWVTERQYTNPKFVEDVIRDSVAVLRTVDGVTGFALEVEALESIHGHNAFARHSENFDAISLDF